MLDYDAVIVGGGPAGSTAATLLRKYAPELRVLVLEKEKFPRDHIGESQLPSISVILHEMGVWDKVEAAGFPIKIGASYTWGRSGDRWEFDFYPPEEFKDEARPAKFEGQRRLTAFQVDRSVYDKILLDHAASMGAEVREETRVTQVFSEGDRIYAIEVEGGETITARWFIDASGTVGLLRRALGIQSEVVDELKNIAIWDYWQNAEWAVEIGVGATRIQVRSLPYGWMWFIPLSPTRTSVGLVTPSDYYRKQGKSAEELYRQAVADQPEVSKLTRDATREMLLTSCRDWSQLSERLVGENWFVVGEAAGFADPILSAGMSLAHASARDAAYTLMELDRGELDAGWLRDRFNDRNRSNILQHIRFGQYWYSANSCFTELREACQRIADQAGMKLTPQGAWRWLSQGGFTTQELGIPGFGSFDIFSAKQLIGQFDSENAAPGIQVDGYNVFTLNLRGARKSLAGNLSDGRIEHVQCYERGGRRIPVAGYYGLVIEVLSKTSDARTMMDAIHQRFAMMNAEDANLGVQRCVQALDVMIQDGWVKRSLKKGRPVLRIELGRSRLLRSADQTDEAMKRGAKGTLKNNI